MRPDENKRRNIVICGKGSGGSTTVEWDDILNKPEFATVATSGDYDDLTDKPTILTQWFGTQAEYDLIDPKDPNTVYNIEGSDNVQADWNQSDTTADDFIKNKPTIPSETETLTFTLQGGTVVSLEVYVKPDESPYFYVENNDSSDITFDIVDNNYDPANPFDLDIYGSTDQENWSLLGNTTTGSMTATVPANGRLYIKANTDSWCQTQNINFNISDPVNVGGNIMSLLYGDDYKGKKGFPSGSDSNFFNLFNNCSIVSAEDLILPATTLAEGCYSAMFFGCASLTTAPALPATTLVQWCYMDMFRGCTGLTAAPVLPATTLTEGCYSTMFFGCTNLNSVTTYAQDISANSCLNNWLSDVAATGDFYNLGGATYPSGVNGIPTGWTEHTSL